MLRARVIPCLLLHKRGLVKTVKFKNPRYIGDPINAVRIFNEKEVDELVVLDIDATTQGREPDYSQIEDIVSEAFMPVCYGGGVSTVSQMRKLFHIGVEKISISSAAVQRPALITEAANIFGRQSIVVTLDIKRTIFKRNYQVVIKNASQKTGLNPLKFAKQVVKLGAGELLINNVDLDGTMRGYDLPLLKNITDSVEIPVIALGGAGSIQDLGLVIQKAGVSAAAAGSLFVYHGKHKAVLINYPTEYELKEILGVSFHE